jgi:hypothetical protein
VLFTAIGVSPVILVAFAYQMLKERAVKNILLTWFLAYAAFVLMRTPQSHEYYSLPLMPPVAIFAAALLGGTEGKMQGIVLMLAVASAVACSFVLLSYSGDAGYTATKDVAEFINGEMNTHPEDTYLIVTDIKYKYRQFIWYCNLTMDAGSKRMFYEIENITTSAIDEAVNKHNATTNLLITDRPEAIEKACKHCTPVYISTYTTKMPSLKDKNHAFTRSLTVYHIPQVSAT